MGFFVSSSIFGIDEERRHAMPSQKVSGSDGQPRAYSVRVRPPEWMMKRFCPVCGQGSSLVFVACPECSQLVIQCAEDGSFFLNPYDLSSPQSAELESTVCPGCGKHPVTAFSPATDSNIRANGFTAADYE